jgi:hypothetical protein
MPADPLHQIRLHDAGDDPEIEADEVDAALLGLAELIRRTSSPVVKACLEEARDDIAHLTSREDRLTKDGEEKAAA